MQSIGIWEKSFYIKSHTLKLQSIYCKQDKVEQTFQNTTRILENNNKMYLKYCTFKKKLLNS